MHWFNSHFRVGLGISGSIIMVRRVSWVGVDSKRWARDCVVVNFNQPSIVAHVLAASSPPRFIDPTGILALPLRRFATLLGTRYGRHRVLLIVIAQYPGSLHPEPFEQIFHFEQS